MAEVFTQLEEIFRDVLGDDTLALTPDTTPVSLPGWDSLAHVNVLFSVEETFGVQFSTAELDRMKTIGDLHRALLAKGLDSS